MASYHQGVLTGFAIASLSAQGAYVYWLYVDASVRGQRVGLRLLEAVRKLSEKRGARSMSLATHNHQGYYRRHGFETIDQRDLHGVEMDIMKMDYNP